MNQKLNFKNNVQINDKKNNLIIYSDKINYNLNKQKIFGRR